MLRRPAPRSPARRGSRRSRNPPARAPSAGAGARSPCAGARSRPPCGPASASQQARLYMRHGVLGRLDRLAALVGHAGVVARLVQGVERATRSPSRRARRPGRRRRRPPAASCRPPRRTPSACRSGGTNTSVPWGASTVSSADLEARVARDDDVELLVLSSSSDSSCSLISRSPTSRPVKPLTPKAVDPQVVPHRLHRHAAVVECLDLVEPCHLVVAHRSPLVSDWIRSSSRPTFSNAASARSMCSGSIAADICTRTRAVPSGTTG